MTEVKYCDSSGLSALLVGNRICQSSGGTFILAELQPNVEKLILISQLNRVLKLIPTLSEASDYMLMEAIEKEFKEES